MLTSRIIMLKLYEEQKDTFYKISQELKISSAILYDYASGKRSIDNMTVKVLYNLAEYERMSMNQLYLKIKEYQSKQKKS